MWEGRQSWILVGVACQPGNLPLPFTHRNWTPICPDPNYGFSKLPPPSREAELTRKGWVGLQLLKNLNALSHFRTGLWGVGCTRSSDCPLRVWDTSWTETHLECWNGNKPLPFLGPQKNRDSHITGEKIHAGAETG